MNHPMSESAPIATGRIVNSVYDRFAGDERLFPPVGTTGFVRTGGIRAAERIADRLFSGNPPGTRTTLTGSQSHEHQKLT